MPTVQELLLSYMVDHIGPECCHIHQVVVEELPTTVVNMKFESRDCGIAGSPDRRIAGPGREHAPDYSKAVAEAELGYSRIAEEEAAPVVDSPGTLGVV